MNDEYDPFDEDIDFKSKTQVKKEMQDLRDLGESLIALTQTQRNSLNLPQKLQEAIEEAPRIKNWNAQKRHLSFIGKLLRDVDIEALTQSLNQLKEKGHRGAKLLPFVEQWTDKLIDGENDQLQAFIEQHPQCEIQQLRQLIRHAKKEKKEGKTTKQRMKLFKMIQKEMAEG